MTTGEVTVEKIGDRTIVTHEYARYPLKFLHPINMIQKGYSTAVSYILGYGGGLVSRDNVSISILAKEDTTLVLCTQATTKVYKCLKMNVEDTTQEISMNIEANAFVVLVPDPVTCFQDAKYMQRQLFTLQKSSSLILLDWMTSGRQARGEHWAFQSYESYNEIAIHSDKHEKEYLLVDRMRLRQDETIMMKDRMGGMHVMGTLVLTGPQVQPLVTTLLAQGARQKLGPNQAPIPSGRLKHENTTSVVRSAISPLGKNGAIIRLCSPTTDDAYAFVKEVLQPLEQLIGFQCFQENR